MILHNLDSLFCFFSPVLASTECCSVCMLSLCLSVQPDDVIHLSVYMSLMLFNYVVEIFGSTFGKCLELEMKLPFQPYRSARVSPAVAVGDPRRAHLLFCFRATVFVFLVAGVSSPPPPPSLPINRYAGSHQPQRRRLLQSLKSLKLMANKIACLLPSHAGTTHQDLSLE